MLKNVTPVSELDEDVRFPPRGRMSEGEFVEWCGPKTRADWADGKVIIMSPDSFEHSDLVTWLLTAVRAFVDR